MKILLIGNLPEDRQESMRRFTTLLHEGLRARGHSVRVVAPSLRLARFGPHYRYGGVPKYLGYFDKFVLFPRRLRADVRNDHPDVAHVTDQAGAVYAEALGCVPSLATCHDLLEIRAARGEIPQRSLGPGGRLYQSWILAKLPVCRHLACVSDKTRSDVSRLTGLPSARLTVVPNALHYPYQRADLPKARARLASFAVIEGLNLACLAPERGGFLLQVGGAQWYKNRTGLLTLFAALRRRLKPAPMLVMVGPPLSSEHEELAARLGVRSHIVRLANVTCAQLEALYTLAEGLLFPSWEEGFGWPVAEAQACGCVVFASNRAPMTEVGGPAAIYFDPAEPVAAAGVIAAAWRDRATLRAAALEAAHRWEPGLMLDAYESLYRRLAP